MILWFAAMTKTLRPQMHYKSGNGHIKTKTFHYVLFFLDKRTVSYSAFFSAFFLVSDTMAIKNNL